MARARLCPQVPLENWFLNFVTQFSMDSFLLNSSCICVRSWVIGLFLYDCNARMSFELQYRNKDTAIFPGCGVRSEWSVMDCRVDMTTCFPWRCFPQGVEAGTMGTWPSVGTTQSPTSLYPWLNWGTLETIESFKVEEQHHWPDLCFRKIALAAGWIMALIGQDFK